MSKTLIIIDCQNDFITGSLANKAAEDIVEPICEYIRNNKFDNIFMTRDTHQRNYLETPEGKKLPIEHCIEGTAGWCVNDKILKAVTESGCTFHYFDKPTFGSTEWWKEEGWIGEDITIVGTCTSICVCSNALILKATYPDADIKVIGNLCADLTPEKHNAALEVMRSCQIEVI